MELPATLDFYFGVLPVVFSTSFIAVALAVFTVIRHRLPATKDPFFHQYYRWFVSPVVRALAAMRVTPNQVTMASLVIALASAVAIGLGFMLTGLFLLFVAASCDTMDGALARHQGVISEQGAFFDSFIDRVSEAVIFGGLAYSGGGDAVTWLSILALASSLCVSYARARGQSLGVDINVGIMSRPARLVAVLFALLFGGLGAALAQPWSIGAGRVALLGLLGFVGVMSTITAGRRALGIMQALAQRDALTAAAASAESSDIPTVTTVAQVIPTT